MKGLESILQVRDLLRRSLDDDLPLVRGFKHVLPPINRLHRRKDVHTSREAFINENFRERLGIFVEWKRCQDHDDLFRHDLKTVGPQDLGTSSLQPGQGLFEIRLQIFDVLDANRDADQAVGDAEHFAPILGHRGVRHDCRV